MTFCVLMFSLVHLPRFVIVLVTEDAHLFMEPLTGKNANPLKFLADEGQNGPKSHLEVLAEMRDYKRRRQSYRAKNVHITKKTYTEVF